YFVGGDEGGPPPRLDRHPGDATDRRKCLAAKAHGTDSKEIVGRGKLAGGVIAQRQLDIVGMDALPVIDDADELAAPLLDVDIDARAAGVDAVFQQFLDDAGGALDDFAGGDLGNDGNRKLHNARHARFSHPWIGWASLSFYANSWAR